MSSHMDSYVYTLYIQFTCIFFDIGICSSTKYWENSDPRITIIPNYPSNSMEREVHFIYSGQK